jgi:hypothetical protein
MLPNLEKDAANARPQQRQYQESELPACRRYGQPETGSATR